MLHFETKPESSSGGLREDLCHEILEEHLRNVQKPKRARKPRAPKKDESGDKHQ